MCLHDKWAVMAAGRLLSRDKRGQNGIEQRELTDKLVIE